MTTHSGVAAARIAPRVTRRTGPSPVGAYSSPRAASLPPAGCAGATLALAGSAIGSIRGVGPVTHANNKISMVVVVVIAVNRFVGSWRQRGRGGKGRE